MTHPTPHTPTTGERLCAWCRALVGGPSNHEEKR